MADTVVLHPALEPLAFLIGTWQGRGHGFYPTIDPFDYTETATYSHVGKPFLAYVQRTAGVDGLPLHTESGYLRPVGHDRTELVLSQPSGIVEIHEGSITGTSIELRTLHVVVTPTAKEVASVVRRIAVVGDTLTYSMDMAAVGQPEQRHLDAVLDRSR